MSNRETGEVTVDIKGKAYTLILDTNALATLEALFSTPQVHLTYAEILLRVHRGSVLYMRGVLWAALRKYHADLTLDAVGDLIQQAGGLERFSAQLLGMVESTQPDPRDVQELGIDPSRPRKARRSRSTGARSSSPVDASV